MLMQSSVKFFGVAGTLMAAASLAAGGLFMLEMAKPTANSEAQAKHAILVVRGIGCAAPEKSAITATAEGFVNGKREEIPLKLIPLSSPGLYALTRQWPAEGKRVISLVGTNPNFNSQPSLLVKVEGDSVDWAGVTRLSHAPNTQEIEAALNTAVASKLE
jgi:hypothetical protein